MKVYVVSAEVDEWFTVEGVFSSMEAANRYVEGRMLDGYFEVWESWVDEDRQPACHIQPTAAIDEALGLEGTPLWRRIGKPA